MTGIEVSGLVKRFGRVTAVDGLSFTVRPVSLGMRQRLGLAVALLGDPQTLVPNATAAIGAAVGYALVVENLVVGLAVTAGRDVAREG